MRDRANHLLDDEHMSNTPEASTMVCQQRSELEVVLKYVNPISWNMRGVSATIYNIKVSRSGCSDKYVPILILTLTHTQVHSMAGTHQEAISNCERGIIWQVSQSLIQCSVTAAHLSSESTQQ